MGMKNDALIFAGIGILIVIALSSFTGSGGGDFDFSSLVATYGADNVNRLTNLYQAMQGKGLSDLQTRLMLSQALHETGLFTASPNYNLMDNNNNFAGITKNSRYPNSPNAYADYPDLNTFVNDWVYVLGLNNQPINATGPDDFVTRLQANGYFTDSYATYDNAVNSYYNLLNQTITTS